MQIITESVKTKKSWVSWKMFEMEFKVSKFSSMKSKALCLEISETTKRLAVQSTAYTLLNLQCKQAFVKENEKNIFVKEICKFLEIYGWRNDFLLLQSCQLYLIANYKASKTKTKKEKEKKHNLLRSATRNFALLTGQGRIVRIGALQ